VKDGLHEYLIHGDRGAVNPEPTGTKAAAHYRRGIAPGATLSLRLRLTRAPRTGAGPPPFADFDETLSARRQEAAEFYASLEPAGLDDDRRRVQRQAWAGVLWSKQFYHYDVHRWLLGDPAQPPPPADRMHGRNHRWTHLNGHDIISMPDKWEYPWFAAWDLAFHAITLAPIDPGFAKDQLLVLCRDSYQHPNGQIPAYEWAFGDVNPPVTAWAAWRVYQIDQERRGRPDREFLETVFLKLMLHFTWWVNRKDVAGSNVFEGGFLGLDNIGVFDRSAPLPTGGYIEQSDGTSWMSMFCLSMMRSALELARWDQVYEKLAIKFFEHFLYIALAMTRVGGVDLWDEEDQFFYDVLHLPGSTRIPLKVRSLVGLIPLFAVETIEPDLWEAMAAFRERLEWVFQHRPALAGLVSRWHEPGRGDRRLLALVRGHRMRRLLARMLDPAEFLSDHGVRSVSKYHEQHPYVLRADGRDYVVRYEPAECAPPAGAGITDATNGRSPGGGGPRQAGRPPHASRERPDGELVDRDRRRRARLPGRGRRDGACRDRAATRTLGGGGDVAAPDARRGREGPDRPGGAGAPGTRWLTRGRARRSAAPRPEGAATRGARDGGRRPGRAPRGEPRSGRLLRLDEEAGAPVPGPAGVTVLAADRSLLAVADQLDPVGLDALRDEVRHRRLRPVGAQRQVVLLGAALVAVALDQNDVLRIGPQPSGAGVERRRVDRPDDVRVVVEVDVPELRNLAEAGERAPAGGRPRSVPAADPVGHGAGGRARSGGAAGVAAGAPVQSGLGGAGVCPGRVSGARRLAGAARGGPGGSVGGRAGPGGRRSVDGSAAEHRRARTHRRRSGIAAAAGLVGSSAALAC
jgi:hypothetical protein